MGESGQDPVLQYLNNVVEQDHRRIKSRVQPMLGFKKFYNARRVIIGIEFVHKLQKDQFLIGFI
jgi:transposase-like protein